MPKKEINNKTVNLLFKQSKVIKDLQDKLGDQVLYLTTKIEEFKQIIDTKKYDHTFCLCQLQDGT
jgi:hypothetical protein